MFPTAVCTFRSGEYKTDTCIGKITTAIVNTLRQLLLHIHYHYLSIHPNISLLLLPNNPLYINYNVII